MERVTDFVDDGIEAGVEVDERVIGPKRGLKGLSSDRKRLVPRQTLEFIGATSSRLRPITAQLARKPCSRQPPVTHHGLG